MPVTSSITKNPITNNSSAWSLSQSKTLFCQNYYKNRTKNNLLNINKNALQQDARRGEFDQVLAKLLTLISDLL